MLTMCCLTLLSCGSLLLLFASSLLLLHVTQEGLVGWNNSPDQRLPEGPMPALLGILGSPVGLPLSAL